MSQYFRSGALILWNPSNRVAYLFLRAGEAVAPLVELPTGISPGRADEYEVNQEVFGAFVNALVAQYLSSSHAILRVLVEGFLATALVMADRAGIDVPALGESPVLDPRDISVAVGGIRPLGDAGQLREAAAGLAKAMPR